MIEKPHRLRRAGGLLGAMLLLGLASCSVLDPDPHATIDNPESADPSSLTGEQLYLRECASCHGSHGMPVDTSVKDLRGYAKTFEEFDSTMTLGPSGMPQFPQIDAAARHRLLDYIKSFPPQ